MTYVDSSVLVAGYVTQRFSEAAQVSIQSLPQIPFTALHELEIYNSFEVLIGRKLLTRAEVQAFDGQIREDLATQRLWPVSLDMDRVFAHALEFSKSHSACLLTRSLDLLHVAAAHAAGCARFISADDRQLAVAKATGLQVVDIKRA